MRPTDMSLRDRNNTPMRAIFMKARQRCWSRWPSSPYWRWLGDTSAAGIRQSAGMMVNYVYRLADVERNHEAYARDRTVVASRRLELLARESLLASANGGQA